MKPKDKIYKPTEALKLMGLLPAKESVRIYILNMYRAGKFKSSYKLNGMWFITQEDIDYLRVEIMEGRYKPSARYIKQAA